MATKAQHTQAVLSMKLEWSTADRMLAIQLADLRYTIERKVKLAGKADITVKSAAGTEKANPIFSVLDRLKTQESQLTKRLGLQAMVRNASHNYELNANLTDKRTKLWQQWEDNAITNLMPGMWLHLVRTEKCAIDEDAMGWPNNPKSLPMAGEIHEVGTDYALATPPMAR